MCTRDLQIFINASTSDVVATTSLEALAMGKWLLCAEHPCNAFAARFRNCLTHRSPAEFSRNLQYAQEHLPFPLSPEELRCAPLPALAESAAARQCPSDQPAQPCPALPCTA